MSEYMHGTYGAFVSSVDDAAAKGGTVVVYAGVAPVNLVRGYEKYVNTPVKVSSFEEARVLCGYSDNWDTFDLCEAFHTHFNNDLGNIGPIVVINVLDPATHKKAQATTKELTFSNGSATIESDTIVLDTLVLAEKVEGVDYSVSYDFTAGKVVINSLGDAPITGTVAATFSEVDTSGITEDTVIGGVTDEGVYTGLSCVRLVYQETNLIPNLILCTGWSEKPEVYKAMVKAGTKINGNWDALVYADIPVSTDGSAVNTIAKAKAWKSSNAYTSERSKVFWPRGVDAAGKVVHASVLAAWRTMLVDAENGNIPMETPSNKEIPIVKQYFGEGSVNRGFDRQMANELNADGITTVIFWGGVWVLWGPHTAAFKHGATTDGRDTFDTTIRMLMYVSNSFQKDWALTIDKPMTRALADTIKNREQEKMDALVAVNAFIGKPVVEFIQRSVNAAGVVEGNFTWGFKGTPIPPFKAGTLQVGYTAAGFETYYAEV